MIKIDIDTRYWKIPKEECFLGVESDDKVRILQFELSKNEFYDGLNFTDCNCFINYKNEDNDTIPYGITDMKVQEDGTVTFTWEVSRGATIFKGNTFAVLCAKKVREDGTITNEWNSRIGSFTVSKGLEPLSSITEVPEIDIISQLLLLAQQTNASAQTNINQSSQLLEKAEGLGYLKEEYDVLESRMNQFTSLKEGSTTGDAELIDGRIGYDGKVYDNIGGAIREQVSKLNGDIGGKVDKPSADDEGKIARAKAGGVEWSEVGQPTDLQTENAVTKWLDSHPEATTTVQNHSLDINKMVIGTLGYVTPEMFGAVGDGVTDDTDAIIKALDALPINGELRLSAKTYLITRGIVIQKSVTISGLYQTQDHINRKSSIYLKMYTPNVKIFSKRPSTSFIDTVHLTLRYVDICGGDSFYIDGDTQAPSATDHHLPYTEQIKANGVVGIDWRSGAEGVVTHSYLTIDHCWVSQCSECGIYSGYFSKINCLDLSQCRTGIVLGTDSELRNSRINGCNYGVLGDGNGVQISDCRVEGINCDAMKLTSFATVSGIMFDQIGYSSLVITGSMNNISNCSSFRHCKYWWGTDRESVPETDENYKYFFPLRFENEVNNCNIEVNFKNNSVGYDDKTTGTNKTFFLYASGSSRRNCIKNSGIVFPDFKVFTVDNMINVLKKTVMYHATWDTGDFSLTDCNETTLLFLGNYVWKYKGNLILRSGLEVTNSSIKDFRATFFISDGYADCSIMFTNDAIIPTDTAITNYGDTTVAPISLITEQFTDASGVITMKLAKNLIVYTGSEIPIGTHVIKFKYPITNTEVLNCSYVWCDTWV